MKKIYYKKNADCVIERLKLFYERKASDQIFAEFKLSSKTLDDFSRNNKEGSVQYPDPEKRILFWNSLLKEKTLVEDDSIPSAYLSEFDQGLYGALIGGEIQFLCNPKDGWISSMVKPIYNNLALFLPKQFDEHHTWYQRYIHQLEIFSEASKDMFGISHFILIDGLNFVFELIGATKTYLCLFACPDKVKEVIDFAFQLNVKVQNSFFERTSSYKGGTFSNLAQWIPGRIVSESLDPFHMTSVDDFEQWGKNNVEKMFNEFDGGVLHIHSNGRHLLNAVSKLKGLKAIYLLDERGNPPAFEVLKDIKRQTGEVPLVVEVEDVKFEKCLKDNSLLGGVFYVVSSQKKADEVNRIMEKVRKYRI